MKTEEIVRALRCCAEPGRECEEDCPMNEISREPCREVLAPAAADLIEKLTARCARYAEEIAVAQERARWIPVTERLPEEGVPVLINYIGTNGEVYADGVAVWTECGCFWWEGSLADCEEDVAVPITHWMPLPAPPEVKKYLKCAP